MSRARAKSASIKSPQPESDITIRAEAELKSAFNLIVGENLPLVALGLSLLFLAYAISHPIVQPGPIAWPMTITAAGTALLLAGLYLGLRRRSVPTAWAHPLGAGVAGLVLINSLLHLYLSAEPWQTTNLMLLVIGVGWFFLNGWWLSLVLATTLSGWALVVALVEPSPLWIHFGFALGATALISGLICSARRRTFRRLEQLHRADEQRQGELEAAIQAAQKSEEAFRQLADATSEGIAFYQAEKIVSANQTLARMFGHELSALVDRPLPDLVAPEVHAEFAGYLQTSRSHPYEVLGLKRDGSVFPLEILSHTISAQGRTLNVLLMRDLTEQKRARQALRESDDRFYKVFRASPAAIAITRLRDGRLFDVNDSFLRLIGYDRDEVVGRNPLELNMWVNPAERVRLAQLLQQHNFVSNVEAQFRMKSGEIREALASAELIDLLGEPCVLSLIHDITERKQAEEALRESEARYRELFENAIELIFTQDLAGNLTSINKAGEQLTGYSRDELGQMNWTQLVAPAYLSVAQQMVERTLAGSGPRQTYELEFLAKSGQTISLEVSAGAIYHRGKLVGCQCIARDITDRKRLEAQLRQAQKMESLGTLAGGIAHDFNNILTGIIGFADLTARDLASQERAHSNLQQVQKLAERAANLTSQILTFARRQTIELRPLELNELILELGQFLRRVIGADIELELILADQLATVQGDGAQFQQVLMNLCVNARDAMPQGGKLLIETGNVTLDEAYCRAHPWARLGNYVVLTVTDTGIGMDRTTQDRIFEPFFTTKEVGQGTGLGLAVAYGIVKQHNGLIHVYSEVGQGTTFKIYLPALTVAADAGGESIPAAPPGGTETILVAEDETVLRELMVIILEALGYQVIAAPNGAEALRLFDERAGPIDLVVSDVMMPGINGRQLYELLRQRQPALKFLFISGYSVAFIGEKLLLSESSEFLAKPFNPVELAQKVRLVLDRTKPTN